MGSRNESMDHNRLFEAAEAVLDAIVELAQAHGGLCPYPTTIMGTAEQPECLSRFTLHEIAEATEFLMRAGFIEAQHMDR